VTMNDTTVRPWRSLFCKSRIRPDASDDGVSKISAVRLPRGKNNCSPPLAYSVQNRSGTCSNLYRAIGRFKIVVSNRRYHSLRTGRPGQSVNECNGDFIVNNLFRTSDKTRFAVSLPTGD